MWHSVTRYHQDSSQATRIKTGEAKTTPALTPGMSQNDIALVQFGGPCNSQSGWHHGCVCVCVSLLELQVTAYISPGVTRIAASPELRKSKAWQEWLRGRHTNHYLFNDRIPARDDPTAQGPMSFEQALNQRGAW